ncbi:hypothetical protein N7466_002871 [Penicillium verhagenii]|uniref:uncharacterized protein n=1 Tax=Penicillium verhagenii TaxID=1562060 RepID=UPI0025450119|nr:uncharacterized protein N7466_002871 [Penicillium verhagenii]KAJ5939737.1 hypothetical protein N7466_002871 [Penicillium verhagenii]
MAVRIDVNLFDGSEGKAKKTNCVPLKDFDISKKTLGDVRTALIDNGGLDASRAGSAFCSATGAKVNDSTSFVDYLDILSDDTEEEKQDAEETEESEKSEKINKTEKKEKTEKSSTVTVHNVYIKSTDKKSTDRKAEAKELIKKELNLKLSDKPELLKASIEQLASSFDRADWVAEGNETTLSEKDWNSVIRNNNLLSAHRLVFSNLGRLTDGTKKVKFRRIERAPYSAFVLKPRKFALHEIPNADVKVEVCSRNYDITVGKC